MRCMIYVTYILLFKNTIWLQDVSTNTSNVTFVLFALIILLTHKNLLLYLLDNNDDAVAVAILKHNAAETAAVAVIAQ